MGNKIETLPSGAYRGRITVNGRTYSRTAATKTKVRKALAQVLIDHDQGNPDGHGVTVNQLLNRWLQSRDHLAESTRLDYRYVINTHLRFTIGEAAVTDVTASVLDDLYQHLSCGPTRTRRVHNILSAAFGQAVKWGWIRANPATNATPPTIKPATQTTPTAADVGAIVEAAETVRYGMGLFVRLAAVTGARRGELCALRWTDLEGDELVISRAISRAATGTIDGLTGLVEKTTKTHAARRLVIDTETVAAIRTHRKTLLERALRCGTHMVDNHRLFSDDPAGEVPWRPEQVSRWFRAARTAANVPAVRLHDLRHYVATQSLAAGADVRTVAGRLGHSNVATTLNRYAHVVPAADRAVAETLGSLLGSATQGD